MKTLVFT